MDPPAKPRKRFSSVFWRTLLALLLVLLLLKWGVVDGYEVRGNSMEPLLRDREGAPDRIAVFKRHYDLFEPERFDLVVFDRPLGDADPALASDLAGGLFVKRCVGFPGEKLLIRDGDVYVAPAGGGFGEAEPVLRPLDVLLGMLQTVSRLDPSAPGAEWLLPPQAAAAGAGDGGVDLDGRDEPGRGACIGFADVVRDDWIDAQGVLQRGGVAVNDVGLSFRARALDPAAEIRVELHEAGDTFTAILPVGAPPRIVRQRGLGEDEALAEGSAPCLLPEQDAAILFLNADDRALLLVNGAVVLETRYGRNTPVDGFPENAPALGVRNGRARFSEVEVLRDVHYSEYGCRHGVGEPYAVPEGEYFLLGDNSGNSRDSRHFGSVPRSCFAGRPFLIFRPASRFRFL